MKRLIAFSALLFGSFLGNATEIHVSPTGNDAHPGTLKAPIKTLEKAQQKVRQLKIQCVVHKHITVFLHDGTFRISKPLRFTPEDSGAKTCRITWRAYPNSKPVISGGRVIKGWEKHENGIWKVSLKRQTKLRQLYINDRPAKMAEYHKFVKPLKWHGKFVIKGDEPWAAEKGEAPDGMIFKKGDIPLLGDSQDVELQQRRTWTLLRIALRNVTSRENQWLALLDQPVAAIASKLRWRCGLNLRHCRLYNAYEFINEPGEFYFDRKAQVLYYKPRDGEDLTTATTVVPVTEKLICVKGENLKKRVSYLNFEGITFAHTGWQMMKIGNSYGACAVQSSAYSVVFKRNGNPHKRPYPFYTSTDLPASAVEVNSAKNISFRNNIFRGLGCMALNCENDVSHVKITGNVFQWVEGSGVNIGHPHHTYIGKENDDNSGYGPYNIDNSTDKWDESVEGLVRYVQVNNNLFRDTCWTHWQMSPIAMYYGHHVYIQHNDLKDTPYNSITSGWGWGEFNGIPARRKYAKEGREGGKPSLSIKDIRVIGNKVDDAYLKLCDAGAVYFIGDHAIPSKDPKKQTQYSIVRDNYVISGFRRGYCQTFYTDEGAAFLRIENNVFDGPLGYTVARRGRDGRHKQFVGNFIAQSGPLFRGKKARDPFGLIDKNTLIPSSRKTHPLVLNKWPERAQYIISNAGLQPAYQYLFKKLISKKNK